MYANKEIREKQHCSNAIHRRTNQSLLTTATSQTCRTANKSPARWARTIFNRKANIFSKIEKVIWIALNV